MLQHWLLKSEPSVYSFDHLLKDRKTNWNGVRNFQARNFLKASQEKDDLALIYHSNEGKAVVGVAKSSAKPMRMKTKKLPASGCKSMSRRSKN